MNKYTYAIFISLGSLVINIWIIKQQRNGISIDPTKKQKLERLSYGLIVVAVLFLTFG